MGEAGATDRRGFLKAVGAGIGGLVIGGLAGYLGGQTTVQPETITRTVTTTVGGAAQTVTKTVTVGDTARPTPTTPIKLGSQNFFTGPGALLGLPSAYGTRMGVKEINDAGGIMGRQIELLERDEGPSDATLREFRKLVLEDKIDYYIGLVSSGNTPTVGPEAEEQKILTLFVDGCTDILFERAVPNPFYIFRITNIQSSDAITAAVGTMKLLVERGLIPENPKITGIHPDYAYGRLIHDFYNTAMKKMLPDAEILDQQFPGLFKVTDFSAQITSMLQQNADLAVVSLWGGDYVNWYKQAIGFGLFDKMKVVTTLTFGGSPQAVGKDHPDGHVGGVHANYWFTNPDWELWPVNGEFVKKFSEMWNEYPSFEAEGAYVGMQMLKDTIEIAAQEVGGYPEDEEVVPVMERYSTYGPAGYIQVRKQNHQCYKNAVIGVTGESPEYDFEVMSEVLVLPIEKVSAPAEYPTSKSWLDSWPEGYKP